MIPAFLAAMIAMQPVVATEPLTQVRDGYPRLSPDGRALLFHSNRSGRQAIWIAAADGANPRILFDDPRAGTDPGTPVWSPDGRLIAFAMRPAGAADANESDIYLIDPDGAGLRRLTETPGDDSPPALVPKRANLFQFGASDAGSRRALGPPVDRHLQHGGGREGRAPPHRVPERMHLSRAFTR